MIVKRRIFIELNERLKEVREENEELRKKNNDLNRRIKGERATGCWCRTCKNSVAETHQTVYGDYKTYDCLLDVKCNDYERLEDK